MFVDKVQVKIKAGKGGNGKLSFRHERAIARGGPDGGDGGNGGNLIARASNNENTLANFRYKKEVFAEAGGNGEKRKMHGKNGADLIINLPVGTVVTFDNGKILADLIKDGQQEIIARGGKGGFGNAHFTSSIRQAPRIAELGEPGEEFEVTFELKMIADVGLVGLPNAGKSTLLSRVSNAHPEIANYPFTTVRPNLGVADINKSRSILIADIPGLIEGASQGKGLGDEFLRHVERTKLLIHLIDAYENDIEAAYETIQTELQNYTIDLSKKPQIIALNKTDGLDAEIVAELMSKLQKVVGKKASIFAISAQSGQGVKDLLFAATKLLDKSKAKQVSKPKDAIPVIRLEKTDDKWQVKKTQEGYLVTGSKIEKFAYRTDFDNYDALRRLRDIMRKMGIIHELERKKIKLGDKIIFGKSGIGRLEY